MLTDCALGRGWRERLVDVSIDDNDPLHLRMVLAPNQTPASKLLLSRRLEALPPDAGLHPFCKIM